MAIRPCPTPETGAEAKILTPKQALMTVGGEDLEQLLFPIFDIAAEKKATLLAFDQVLGLNIATWQPPKVDVPEAVLKLAAQRQDAREAKDWGRADELRDEALAAGYVIEDTKDGPIVKKA